MQDGFLLLRAAETQNPSLTPKEHLSKPCDLFRTICMGIDLGQKRGANVKLDLET